MTPKKIIKKPWTAAHVKKFNWLFNYYKQLYPDAEIETFIDINKKSLMSLIEKNENWKDGSREGLLFMVARYLHNKGETRYNKMYSETAHNLTLKIRAHEEHNELDEREEANFRTHEFFETLINNINIEDINTIEQHYKYLLLNMLVYQPPLRTSFYSTAKFLRAKDDNDKINNFVWINRRGMLKINYIVNRDKASNYKVYNINKNLSSISIEDEKLVKLINNSYIKYPRTYLFELKNKAVSSSTLLNWLKNITNVDGLNFDIMRSSYITWFYEKNQTMASKTKLSHQMRHSTDTAQRNYLKVFEADPILIQNKNDELMVKIAQLENEIKDYSIQLKAFQTNKDDVTTYKKRRSDIIYRLNKGTKPRQETLKQYNIIFDDVLKVYT